MTKKMSNQRTQKIVQLADASNASPSSEMVSKTSDTLDIEKNKNKGKNLHICKCKENTKVRKDIQKTWKSITNMYGSANTTEVWDNHKHEPENKVRTKFRYKLKQVPQNNKSDKRDVGLSISKLQRNKKLSKKSIISLYRKPKENTYDHRLKNRELAMEAKKFKSPIISFKLQQKSKKSHFGTGDTCTGALCREALKCYYKSLKAESNANDFKNDKLSKLDQVCKCRTISNEEKATVKSPKHEIDTLKYKDSSNIQKDKQSLKKIDLCKCKTGDKVDKKSMQQQIRIINEEVKKINKGHGDQPILVTTGKVNNVKNNIKRKCNVINTILKRFCNYELSSEYTLKKLENAGDQTGEPFFAMKVDFSTMQVLNASEIKDNIKTYGKLQSRRSCVCPSRIKKLKRGKSGVCKKGYCERASKNKRTNFDCKCIIKNNVIECKDTTCDTKKIMKQKKKTLKSKFYRSPTYVEKNKPLFEVMLDPVNMSIINTTEVHDVFKKSSNNKLCPTGICSMEAKNKDMQINCKCIKKKIIPKVTECSEKTCNELDKKFNLSYLRSKVFSKSENWIGIDKIQNRHRHNVKPAIHTVIKKDIKTKSDIHKRNGLNVNVSKNHKQKERGVAEKTITDVSDVMFKGFCECTGKKVKAKDIKIQYKDDKNKTKKKRNLKDKKQRRHVIRRPKVTFKNRLLYCLRRRKRGRCQNKLKKEEKAFKENEKRRIKENRKIKRKLERSKKTDVQNWNCLTNFVSGFLNLTTNSIKNVIIAVFSLIANPIGSYVYIRESTKNPRGTIRRIKDWFIRTWRNKSTKVSQSVKDSDAMNVIADQIEQSAIYDTLFADKGRTKEEKALYKTKKRLRERRIRKRHDRALYGCQHMLLTTMRKTPCLWFYHICPDLYPQCLSLVAFMKNFLSVIIYLLAFLCWTPCIVSFEICRAFLCCFFCTH